jgi:hypothetical protein
MGVACDVVAPALVSWAPADRVKTDKHGCRRLARLRAVCERSRDYLWVRITTATRPGGHRWLLDCRNRSTGELAFSLCWSPRPVPLHALVRVAGSRWSIEELFPTDKGQVGPDHYQVRGWTAGIVHHPGHARPGRPDILGATAQPKPDPVIIWLTIAEIGRTATPSS